jgi:hypothetical protein
VNEDDEFAGLDLSQHSENAYVFATGGYGGAPSEAFGARPAHVALGAHAMSSANAAASFTIGERLT